MSDVTRPSVLIVDDDPSIRESLRFLFEEANYVVEEANDGAAALALVRADPRPRVMLLDRMMSRVDGAATLRQLANESATLDHMAILFMSARNDPPAPGINDLIQRYTITTIMKPFQLDDLLDMVDQASARLMRQTGVGRSQARQADL